jgi:hypothetical protein
VLVNLDGSRRRRRGRFRLKLGAARPAKDAGLADRLAAARARAHRRNRRTVAPRPRADSTTRPVKRGRSVGAWRGTRPCRPRYPS